MQIACEVEREYGQYHIFERGQIGRGTTVTDEWLKKYGFWPLGKHNIEAVCDAIFAGAGGVALDPYAASRMPEELRTKEETKFYPRGREHLED